MLNIEMMASFITYSIFLHLNAIAQMNTVAALLFSGPFLLSLMQTSALEVWYVFFVPRCIQTHLVLV